MFSFILFGGVCGAIFLWQLLNLIDGAGNPTLKTREKNVMLKDYHNCMKNYYECNLGERERNPLTEEAPGSYDQELADLLEQVGD